MSKRRSLGDSWRSLGRGDNPLPKRSHEEWRDWANLPSLLIDDIAGRLLRYDVSEYLRLRAACKEWRENTADPRGGSDLDRRFRPRRWILLSNNTDGVHRRFLNLATGACAHVDLPELSGHHLETTTEGLLVLLDKASDVVRLLDPLTKALTDLPSITEEFRILCRSLKEEGRPRRARVLYAGISDETSPATVVIFLHGGALMNIAYAKAGDERWSLMEDAGWRDVPSRRIFRNDGGAKTVRYRSVLTLRGRVYFSTMEGNILKVRIHPKPRLVPVVKEETQRHNVCSYLVPADDDHSGMLVVRIYNSLRHLSEDEQRRLKRKQNRDVIKVEYHKPRRYLWYLIQVFEVDLAGKRLVQAGDIGRRAVVVGNMACFSLSAKTFPSVAGNAVYLGTNMKVSSDFGVRYLTDKSVGPPFEFAMEDEMRPVCPPWLYAPRRTLVPLARPCSLQEYLVCCAGFNGGMD